MGTANSSLRTSRWRIGGSKRWGALPAALRATAKSTIWFCLLCVMGCVARGPDAARLVLISPHRDEIREECALAFQDWLRERGDDPVEIVWQDIGGGTSQISRYVNARFETNPDGIGIDIVFGGGTDIF